MIGHFTNYEVNGFASPGIVRIDKIDTKTGDVFPFYYRDKPQRFNLPPGDYISHTEIRRLKNRLPNHIRRVPRPEVNDYETAPGYYILVISPNPNKASINLKSGVITIDPELAKNEIIKNYVIEHELGHYYYRGNGQESERKCDMFAMKRMIDKGYNRSQIEAAIKSTLHPANDRVCTGEKFLKNGRI